VRRIALAAALLSLLVAACDEAEGGPVEGPGYRAELPDGWEDAGTGGSAGETVEDATGAEVKSVWVRSDPDGSFKANINVTFEDVPAGLDPLELARQSRQELAGAGIPDELDEALNVSALTEPTETTLGGEPAATFDYLNEITLGTLQQRSVIAVRGSRAVIVTASAKEDAFEERQPEFDEIFESWEWKAKG
jgi:hypothetical protein